MSERVSDERLRELTRSLRNAVRLSDICEFPDDRHQRVVDIADALAELIEVREALESYMIDRKRIMANPEMSPNDAASSHHAMYVCLERLGAKHE